MPLIRTSLTASAAAPNGTCALARSPFLRSMLMRFPVR